MSRNESVLGLHALIYALVGEWCTGALAVTATLGVTATLAVAVGERGSRGRAWQVRAAIEGIDWSELVSLEWLEWLEGGAMH